MLCIHTLQMQNLIAPVKCWRSSGGQGEAASLSPFHMEMSATRASLIPDTSWEERGGWCFETDVLWHSELPHHVEWAPRWSLGTSFNYNYEVQTPRTSPQISYSDYIFQKLHQQCLIFQFRFPSSGMTQQASHWQQHLYARSITAHTIVMSGLLWGSS